MKEASFVNFDRGRFCPRIVKSQVLKETTIPRAFLICRNDTITRLMPGANPA
jgi:hypothetical protein